MNVARINLQEQDNCIYPLNVSNKIQNKQQITKNKKHFFEWNLSNEKSVEQNGFYSAESASLLKDLLRSVLIERRSHLVQLGDYLH